MSTITNPLLDFSDLPRFDTFQPEYVSEAIDTLINEAQAVVAKLEAPASVVTDSSGFATFNVLHGEQYVPWIDFEITARASVAAYGRG